MKCWCCRKWNFFLIKSDSPLISACVMRTLHSKFRDCRRWFASPSLFLCQTFRHCGRDFLLALSISGIQMRIDRSPSSNLDIDSGFWDMALIVFVCAEAFSGELLIPLFFFHCGTRSRLAWPLHKETTNRWHSPRPLFMRHRKRFGAKTRINSAERRLVVEINSGSFH